MNIRKLFEAERRRVPPRWLIYAVVATGIIAAISASLGWHLAATCAGIAFGAGFTHLWMLRARRAVLNSREVHTDADRLELMESAVGAMRLLQRTRRP